MFGIERRSLILNQLNEKKSILVQDIAVLFSVTEETIRRDLKVLEQQGLLLRTHGGAILPDDIISEPSLEVRQIINISGKDTIGKEAAKKIFDGDTIILDASTSSLYVAKNIKDRKGITVITNAQKVLLELSDCPEITLISTGGTLRHKSMSFVGRSAENVLDCYYANKAFISSKGFSPNQGLTDSNELESDIRKKMINRSQQVIFLCDHTKFNKVGYLTTTSLDNVDIIITDVALPDHWLKEPNLANIEIIIAK
jgi:DeoR/GlpR family transcriptional regulator of sugar metabolism